MYEQNRRAEAARKRDEEERLARQSASLQRSAKRLEEEERQVKQEQRVLSVQEQELASRERRVRALEYDLALREAALDPNSEQMQRQKRTEYARKRYFGFAPHNTTANQLLYLVVRQEHGKLREMVEQLPEVNDFELPAYFQEGVYANPESRSVSVSLSALEAALWLMHIPSLDIFQQDILKRRKAANVRDQAYYQFLQEALDQIQVARSDFASKVRPTLDEFIQHIGKVLASGDSKKLDQSLRKAGYALESLRGVGKSSKDGSLVRKFPLYWMGLPQIVLNAQPMFAKTQEGDAKRAVKRILDEMINTYLTESFSFLTERRERRPEDYRALNRMFTGESIASSSSDERYHALKFDAHTGQLFDHDGDEVELVESFYGDAKRLLKKGGSKTVSVTKSGFAKTKKALSGPERIYYLFLNKDRENGTVTIGGGAYPTRVQLQVKSLSPYRGTITVKGNRSGFFGKKGTKEIAYPALIVVPEKKRGEYHIVAHARAGSYRISPTGSSYSRDKLVQAFWTKVNALSSGFSRDSEWQAAIEEVFNEVFKARRTHIQEHISSMFIASDIFSHPLEEEESEVHTATTAEASSSSSSSLEQF